MIIIVCIIAVVVVVIAALILRKFRKVKIHNETEYQIPGVLSETKPGRIISPIQSSAPEKQAELPKRDTIRLHDLNNQPEVKPQRAIPPDLSTPRGHMTVSRMDDKNDADPGAPDISRTFDAVVLKYALESLTIATCDGLVFASSTRATAHEDAARYSEIFCHDPLSETPGVVLYGLNYQGSNLVGIIRTPAQISEKMAEAIENDTKDILNRWV